MSVRPSLPHRGNIHRVVLPNGITLLAYHHPAVRSVNLLGSLACGSVYEQADERLVAQVMGDMLLRGTRSRTFDHIASALEDIGATLSLNARAFTMAFSGKALAEDLPTLLALLADVLQHPSFPAEQLALVQQEMATSYQFALQDSRFRANRALREALYPEGHALHQPLAGYLDALHAITPDALHRFHQRVASPQHMTVVIVGAVEPLLAEQTTRDILGGWQAAGQPLPVIPAVPPPTQQQHIHTWLAGKTQSDIMMARLAPSRLAPDYLTASLANSVLGEFGMMGRLGRSIRERAGLAYYASSSLEPSLVQGLWSISAGVADRNVALAVQKAQDEIRRLTDELISEEELADNQSYFIGNLPLRLESSAGLAAMLEAMERYQLGLDYLLHYRDTIHAITRQDVQRVASRYLDADAFTISTAGSSDLTLTPLPA